MQHKSAVLVFSKGENMRRHEIIAAVDNAIEAGNDVMFYVNNGNAVGMTFSIVPDRVEDGGNGIIIIYSGGSMFAFNITDFNYDELEEIYFFKDGNWNVAIEF